MFDKPWQSEDFDIEGLIMTDRCVLLDHRSCPEQRFEGYLSELRRVLDNMIW